MKGRWMLYIIGIVLAVAGLWMFTRRNVPNSAADRLWWIGYDLTRRENPPEVQAVYDRELVEY